MVYWYESHITYVYTMIVIRITIMCCSDYAQVSCAVRRTSCIIFLSNWLRMSSLAYCPHGLSKTALSDSACFLASWYSIWLTVGTLPISSLTSWSALRSEAMGNWFDLLGLGHCVKRQPCMQRYAFWKIRHEHRQTSWHLALLTKTTWISLTGPHFCTYRRGLCRPHVSALVKKMHHKRKGANRFLMM